MSYWDEYKAKLTTAEEVAAKVQSGQTIKLGYFNGKPVTLIKALAERHAELRDVLLMCCVTVPPIPEVINYPESFLYQDWHWSAATRALRNYYDNITYAPMLYHTCVDCIQNGEVNQGRKVDWCWQQVGPMDENGFFNFGPNCSESLTSFLNTKYRCVEVNKNMPRCLGGSQEAIHISQIDFIVEAPEDQKLAVLPEVPPPTEVEKKMAENLVQYIHDGCCLQLGIGGLPNAIGKILKDAGVKDIGIHTEMFVDAFMDMIEAGVATGAKKKFDKFKAVYTFALGTQKLYDFMHENAALATYSVDYVNDPRTIAMHDNFISINQAVQVDLLTQVNAESSGFRQISGNGGMTDFVLGAQWSKGGKSFICLPSTYTDKDGNLVSRIVPAFEPGTSVTISRHMVDYIATEYGVKKMRAQNQWVRTENIIELAHPKFRDDLIKAA
ncbi:Acyl-CoA hydrolase, partial [Thermosyntropha lipolytica DSM 11003]